MAFAAKKELCAKLHTVLKKHYTVPPKAGRTQVLEELIYATLLRNAGPAAAEACYARLADRDNFVDWNEMRVSSIRDLSSYLGGLPTPPATAARLKHALQWFFDQRYAYDCEEFRKVGKDPAEAEEFLRPIYAISPFVIQQLTLTIHGAHVVPLDEASASVLVAVGLMTAEEAKEVTLEARPTPPGVEAPPKPPLHNSLKSLVPKAKCAEFTVLLQQAAADFRAAPTGAEIAAILTAAAGDYQSRLIAARTYLQNALSRTSELPTVFKPITTPVAGPLEPGLLDEAGEGPAPVSLVAAVLDKPKPIVPEPKAREPLAEAPAPKPRTIEEPPPVADVGKPVLKAPEKAADKAPPKPPVPAKDKDKQPPKPVGKDKPVAAKEKSGDDRPVGDEAEAVTELPPVEEAKPGSKSGSKKKPAEGAADPSGKEPPPKSAKGGKNALTEMLARKTARGGAKPTDPPADAAAAPVPAHDDEHERNGEDPKPKKRRPK